MTTYRSARGHVCKCQEVTATWKWQPKV